MVLDMEKMHETLYQRRRLIAEDLGIILEYLLIIEILIIINTLTKELYQDQPKILTHLIQKDYQTNH